MSTEYIKGVLALAVAGCAVGPDYRQTAAHAPAAWSSPVASG